MADVFNRAAKSAGYGGWETSPQHFRRSCASYVASMPESGEQDLRRQFGWSLFSSAPGHYIAKFGPSTDINIGRGYGVDPDGVDELPPLGPIVCERCNEYTVRHFDECIHCGLNIDDEQQQLPTTGEISHPDQGEMDLNDMVIDGEVTAAELRALQKLEPHIKTERDVFEDLDKLIAVAERLKEHEETTANALLGVTGLLASGTRRVISWLKDAHCGMTVSPGFDGYPPTGRDVAGIATGTLLTMLVATPIYLSTATGQAAIGGDGGAIAATTASN